MPHAQCCGKGIGSLLTTRGDMHGGLDVDSLIHPDKRKRYPSATISSMVTAPRSTTSAGIVFVRHCVLYKSAFSVRVDDMLCIAQTSFCLPSDVFVFVFAWAAAVALWDGAAAVGTCGAMLGGAPAPVALTSARSLKSSCRTCTGVSGKV